MAYTDKTIIDDIFFLTAMKVFRQFANWPALVMTISKPLEPHVEHRAQWTENGNLRVCHRYGDYAVQWECNQSVCNERFLGNMIERSIKKLAEMSK
jgi:hypothetical protein